jgi:hypothetical protein
MKDFRNSKSKQQIIAAYQLGYRVDEYGNVYNPKGRRLKPFRRDTGKYTVLQFSAIMDPRREELLRPVGSKNRCRCNIDLYRFIQYCKVGEEAFATPIIHVLDGNKLNLMPENIGQATHQEATVTYRRNRQRKAARRS